MKGTAVVPGYAIGRAVVRKKCEKEMPLALDGDMAVLAELERFETALITSMRKLDTSYKTARETLSGEEAEIFAVHRALLDDPTLIDAIRGRIRTDKLPASRAIASVIDEYTALFDKMDDEYLKARKYDLLEIGSYLTQALHFGDADCAAGGEEPFLLVTAELLAGDLLGKDAKRILGVIAERGNLTAHASIVCKSLGIPFVIGIEGITELAAQGVTAVLDGFTGTVFLEPDEETCRSYRQKIAEHKAHTAHLQQLVGIQAATADGVEIQLYGNAAGVVDVKAAAENGAAGIGLFRTEFLFMDRPDVPDEEEQFCLYRDAAVAMNGRCLTIRTMDVGGDKEIASLQMQKEENSFLGVRGVRLSLMRPALFRTQLRAILRASAYGCIRLMFPMVCSIDEIRQIKGIVFDVQRELTQQGISFDNGMHLGVMVEIPSLAIMADLLFNEVDFVSIGTNDLTQYLLAADRTNYALHGITSVCHPALVRLLQNVIRCGAAAGKEVGVCGEMAGMPQYVPLLLGIGLREFSVSPPLVSTVKKSILDAVSTDCAALAASVLKCATAEEAEILL